MPATVRCLWSDRPAEQAMLAVLAMGKMELGKLEIAGLRRAAGGGPT